MKGSVSTFVTPNHPRAIATLAFVVGLVGLGASLPLLSTVRTSLYFLLGASAWGFLLWRALSQDSRHAFVVGWTWCVLLHLGLLPISFFIPALLGTRLPLPLLILVMVVLSGVGLVLELILRAQTRAPLDPDVPNKQADGPPKA